MGLSAGVPLISARHLTHGRKAHRRLRDGIVLVDGHVGLHGSFGSVFTSPNAQFAWPGVILIFPPTPTKTKFSGAGLLLSSKRLLSLNLSLKVTRAHFSDVLRMLEANRLKDLHFTVDEETDGSWRVHSWGIQVKTQQGQALVHATSFRV